MADHGTPYARALARQVKAALLHLRQAEQYRARPHLRTPADSAVMSRAARPRARSKRLSRAAPPGAGDSQSGSSATACRPAGHRGHGQPC